MAKAVEKLEALKLRRHGLSIKAIAKCLEVSVGSVSRWCSVISLTPNQRETLFRNMVASGHLGRMRGAQVNKERKLKRIQDADIWAEKHLKKLSGRDFLVAGAMLYWGEGDKTNRFSFSNSDPHMILFMVRWLRKIVGIDHKDISVRVLINEIHRNRIDDVLRFWKSLLNFQSSQFHKTTFIKTKPRKTYENHDTYYGVAAIRVRNGTVLLYRVLGLIKALQKQAGVTTSFLAPVAPKDALD